MRDLEIRFTPEADRLLSKLHPESKKLINTSLKELHQNPCVGDDLQEELSGFKSYKPKRYRVLYEISEEEDVKELYHIAHRRDVYEQFRLLLDKLK